MRQGLHLPVLIAPVGTVPKTKLAVAVSAPALDSAVVEQRA